MILPFIKRFQFVNWPDSLWTMIAPESTILSDITSNMSQILENEMIWQLSDIKDMEIKLLRVKSTSEVNVPSKFLLMTTTISLPSLIVTFTWPTFTMMNPVMNTEISVELYSTQLTIHQREHKFTMTGTTLKRLFSSKESSSFWLMIDS